ncbi:cytosolic carboxypeptidase 3 isoform X6 [Ascaphus truei]|uniref:cytosolic carboxypeptidase 3 isoform X6 n=1 Tax=Ascaphus truei TaxID=8439 RepID=UPI003F5AA54D
MSVDSEKQDVPSDHTSSDESESEEDAYVPFESEDVHPYEYCSDFTCDPYYQRTTQIVFEYHSGRRVARLKEPRDLYGVSSASALHLPRWPYECEVLKERVAHIEWNPPAPEPMYRPTGLEKEPQSVEPTAGKVVYVVNEASKESCFMCSRVGGNRSPLKLAALQNCKDSDITLDFEARFESGNLQKVVQVDDYDYQLTLRTDLYTNRHTQWFYFRAKNTQAGVPYRFTIINFMKSSSLYNHGMRPLMYSEQEAKTRHVGWHRIGDEIKYYKNNRGHDGQLYFSLSWTFKFPHSRDTCYFAHCYPYTYSNLQDYLAEIANDPERSKYCKIRVLCHSLAGNMVQVLTITNPSSTTKGSKRKKAVILTARVHPGETNSSLVMKGFLDYILSTRSDARLLRDTFIFKVVPMLNPDGVIVGNYRCSLAGRDLNRNYKSMLKDSFPSIWFTRNMIKRVLEEREILLYCDLHGHSRKQNVFMYGCNDKRARAEGIHLPQRIFPLMISKNCPDKFFFPGCKFKVQRKKGGTGRVVMWKMGIRNSYTMEATFCGSTLGKRRGTHFSTKDLESLGYHFCDALLDYCDPDQTKYNLCLKELEETLKQQTSSNNEKPHLDSETFLENVLSDLDSSTGGSDSSDSNGPPAHLMELASKVKPRKKLLKTKRERNSYKKQQGGNITQEPLDEVKTTAGKAQTFIVDQERSNRTVETAQQQRTVHASSIEATAWPKWTTSDFKNSSGKDKIWKIQLSSTEKPTDPEQILTKWRSQILKPQRDQLIPDSDAKKVSVVYLVFNTKGEVITTKSHSCLRKEGVVDITDTFNGSAPSLELNYANGFNIIFPPHRVGFRWNKPLPLLKSFLSQTFPLPLTTILQQCCYSDVPTGNEDTSNSNISKEGTDHKSGDKNIIDRPGKAPVSSAPQHRAKHASSEQGLWARKMQLKKDPSPPLLYDPVNHSLLPPPQRASVSAPPCTAVATAFPKVQDPSGSGREQRCACVEEHHGSNLLSRAKRSPFGHSGSNKKLEGDGIRKQGRDELSLPALTTCKRAIFNGIHQENVLHPKAATQHRSQRSRLGLLAEKTTAETGSSQTGALHLF